MSKKQRQIEEFEAIVSECHAAGKEASKDIPDTGAVGWAWVILPANIPFGRWIKKTTGKSGLSYFSPSSGTRIDAEYHGQAIAGQMAYADAMEKVLKDKGIEAMSWQRYD